MIKFPNAPVISDPRGLDVALNEINSAIITKLTWVNFAFKKAELIKELRNGKEYREPAIFVGGKTKYISLFPDSHKKNFTFWHIEDGQENAHLGPANVFRYAEFRLIFWFSYDLIYLAEQNKKTLENIIAEVDEFFRTTRFQNSAIKVKAYLEDADNIYKGYSHREVDTQFKMRPFGALAVKGRIRYLSRSKCFSNQPDLPAWITPDGQAWVIPS